MSAYAYTAGRHTFANRYSETIAYAERALAVATELDLPEPAFALHWRGVGRCALGDAEGLEDSRRALQLALEQNLGREAAVIYGNLGGVVWLYEGPRAALDVMGEAIAFCERRGITEMVLQTRSAIPAALAELGQTEQALVEARSLADRIEAGGDMSFVATRALQVRLLAECGAQEEAQTPSSSRQPAASVSTGSSRSPSPPSRSSTSPKVGARRRARCCRSSTSSPTASTPTTCPFCPP